VEKGYKIYCMTGCTCCKSENHYTGPFKTREEAESRKKSYLEYGRLGSQYAAKGVYHIEEIEIEILPDGRLICEGVHVLPGWAEDTFEDSYPD
jgi:hypothetical protein